MENFERKRIEQCLREAFEVNGMLIGFLCAYECQAKDKPFDHRFESMLKKTSMALAELTDIISFGLVSQKSKDDDDDGVGYEFEAG